MQFIDNRDALRSRIIIRHDLAVKLDLTKLSLEEAHVWEICSLRSSSLASLDGPLATRPSHVLQTAFRCEEMPENRKRKDQ